MRARRIEGLDPGGALRPNATRIVGTRLEELRALADDALAPDATKAQHDMRIAAKRLRYGLEVFAPCFGDEAEAARRAAKALQSTLGDLHDCHIMLPTVEHVESASTTLHARREHLFHEFVELWQLEAIRGTWSALESALRGTR